MNIADIKKCADKTAIDTVTGVVEKQYLPADQTENDLKFGQHRQSFLIHDDNGEKLMVTLMKPQLHILDNVEGKTMTITAGLSESGESRGMVLNRWKGANSQYESFAVKVYPEATIRATPSGGSATSQKPAATSQKAPATSQPAQSASSDGVSTFEKHLAMVAYAYCLCLDKAAEVISDRPELQTDPTNQRTIATTLWMDCKHHLQTLAPNIHGTTPQVRGNAEPQKAEPAKKEAPAEEVSDEDVITRVVKGYKYASSPDAEVTPKVKKALDKLTMIVDDRNLWEQAYDLMLEIAVAEVYTELGGEHTEDVILLAANGVYDAAKEKLAGKNKGMSVEKLFVTQPSMFISVLKEQVA